jgi:zinc/manganese transport system permease protein
LNLVGGFAALGTLLAVGLMILPAAAARFWVTRAGPMCILAVIIGAVSSALGLLASFHLSAASGPAIILTAGAFYILSMIFGRRGLVSSRVRAHRHRAA